jgi:YbbR domain-containing protein
MINFLRNLFLHDAWLKLFSLGLAILTWFIVSAAVYHKPTSPGTALSKDRTEEQTYVNIEVQVLATAADVRSFKVNPSEVAVTVRGETNVLESLLARDIRALVDLTGIESAPRGLRKRIEVTTPAGVTLVRVVPSEVDVIVPPKR